jgi:hypothetical protein
LLHASKSSDCNCNKAVVQRAPLLDSQSCDVNPHLEKEGMPQCEHNSSRPHLSSLYLMSLSITAPGAAS